MATNPTRKCGFCGTDVPPTSKWCPQHRWPHQRKNPNTEGPAVPAAPKTLQEAERLNDHLQVQRALLRRLAEAFDMADDNRDLVALSKRITETSAEIKQLQARSEQSSAERSTPLDELAKRRRGRTA